MQPFSGRRALKTCGVDRIKTVSICVKTLLNRVKLFLWTFANYLWLLTLVGWQRLWLLTLVNPWNEARANKAFLHAALHWNNCPLKKRPSSSIYHHAKRLISCLEVKEYTNTAWKVSKYWIFSGPYFPAFGLNTERYFASLRIQSECGKIRTR